MSSFGPKVLLTGANGFIAAHILNDLLQGNYQVIGTVRSEAKIKDLLSWTPSLKSYTETNQLRFAIVPSFTEETAWDDVFQSEKFDYVLHTASPFTSSATDFKKDLIEPAVQGTTYLLKSVSKHAPTVKRVIITSSFAAIGDGKNPGPRPGYKYSEKDWQTLTYEDGIAPAENSIRAYSVSKKLAEEAAWDFIKEIKPSFDLTVLNPPVVWGPPVHPVQQSMLKDGGVSTIRFYSLLRGQMEEPLPTHVWLYVDVRDLSRAHVLAMETPDAGGKRLLVSAGNYSFLQIARMLHEKYPDFKGKGLVKIPDESVPDYPTTGVYGGDNSLVKKTLGLEFRSLQQTVEDTVKRMLEVEKKLEGQKL